MNTPTPDNPAHPETGTSTRRNFLEKLGKISFFGVLAGTLTSSGRFLLPNVLYEPPTRFTIGTAEEFPPDSTTFVEEHRLFIFRRPEGLYAISSVCTHLGCNVRWSAEENRFNCPCHGSIFDSNGLVVRGPAPKPLKWYELSRQGNGRLQVDTRRLVKTNFRFNV